MFHEKTIRSYYHYPLRSLTHHKRAYLLLAASVLCMVILCASVLIYYASRAEADIEVMRREDGPQHTVFYDVEPSMVSAYTDRDYIKKALCVDIYASADNPDILANFSQVYFTEYKAETADYFYLDITSGRLPSAFGEILVSEEALRYFEPFEMDTEHALTLYVQNAHREVTFRVVGTFSGAEPALQYVFCDTETAAYLRGADTYVSQYTTDVYLIFKGNSPVSHKTAMQKLIDDLAMTNTDKDGNPVDITIEERNEMLSEVALSTPYYNGATMRMMFLFSILPAGIALLVIIYLDMQKLLGELATLSMIGATWKQICRMQLLKYGIVFCSVFPFGILGAAGLMYLICFLTNRISPDRVFLWYHFSFTAVFVLFLVCAALLFGIVLLLSYRMTAVSHSAMLSAAHNTGNIFVAKTSNLLFGQGHILARIAALFFTRNRKINRLFCAVIVLLVCIYAFYTMQITREYGAAPDASIVETEDFVLYGDTGASTVYDTMLPDLQETIEAIPHVKSVERIQYLTDFYSDISVYVNIPYMRTEKQLVSTSVVEGQFGVSGQYRIWKRGEVHVDLIAADCDYLYANVADEVVDGELSSLFGEENTIALVVNGWSSLHEKYYHVGDTVSVFTTYTEETYDENDEIVYTKQENEAKEYTVGCVIYRPDEYPYENRTTIYCSPALFAEITGVSDIAEYTVLCDSDDDDVLSEVHNALSEMETENHFILIDRHEELRQAKEQALHTVLYVYVMKSFVLLVSVLLLISMTRFMLEVRAPSMRALSLIGAQNRQIMNINIYEFAAASFFSSVIGVLLSVIGTAYVANRFDVAFYFTPITVTVILLGILGMTVINIGIPVLLCYTKIKKYE